MGISNVMVSKFRVCVEVEVQVCRDVPSVPGHFSGLPLHVNTFFLSLQLLVQTKIS